MKLLRSPLAPIASFLSPLIVALFFCAAALPQTAQVAPGAAQDDLLRDWTSGERIAPVAKLPFTAVLELETVNQLSDGTVITHKTYNPIARDSLGRTRHEVHQWIDPNANQETKIIRITLYDPATRIFTDLSPLTKIARQWPGTPPLPVSAQLRRGKTGISSEDLGIDTIEGLRVRGERQSQTYPANLLGNDRPFTVSAESWYSEDLQINLLTKRNDPRLGLKTIRVTQLLRQEPDPSLFTVPEDYKLTTETRPLQQASTDLSGTLASLSVKGVANAGAPGTSVPKCVYCPNPDYTDQARAAKLSGSVVLRIVVNAEGNAEEITVVKKLGMGLDEKAIETVKNWRFKPADGPDGNPVASVVPIEVTFRLR
jgi:TonB family protein